MGCYWPKEFTQGTVKTIASDIKMLADWLSHICALGNMYIVRKLKGDVPEGGSILACRYSSFGIA